MELKEVTQKIRQIFKVDDIRDLPSRILGAILSPDARQYYDAYISVCPDLSEDWLQKTYQFYLSDRKEKKQDYTPRSLALLLSVLTSCGERSVYDACAGSGSLTIRKWCVSPDAEFLCDELDGNVIPLLLFNLALRNISARVRRRDILAGETYEEYRLTRGDRYSSIERLMFPDNESVISDVAISNPPFNLPGRFQIEACPLDLSANYRFIMNGVSNSKRLFGIILPAGILGNMAEKDSREWLFRNAGLKAAISLPENMFESTPVATCILLFDKDRKDDRLLVVDVSKSCDKFVREQRGEGDRSHTERIYRKTFNVFNEDQISAIWEIVECGKEVRNVSQFVDIPLLESHGWSFMLGSYLVPDLDSNTQHRDFNQIISDINRVIRERNIVKVTVNKVWAERLGLDSIIEMSEASAEIVRGINESFRFFKNYEVKEQILEDRYIASSASKVFRIENTDKEILSSIMYIFIPIYKQHLMYLNNEENRLLAELRDAMLPLLMNGKLELSGEQRDAEAKEESL